jgi:hypothetical protein
VAGTTANINIVPDEFGVFAPGPRPYQRKMHCDRRKASHNQEFPSDNAVRHDYETTATFCAANACNGIKPYLAHLRGGNADFGPSALGLQEEGLLECLHKYCRKTSMNLDCF